MSVLLTRDNFREMVFKRDHFKCVICKNKAVDAHHIIDRSLFEDGGYYIDNGVSLCAAHHLDAEYTIISCQELREKAGINNICLPDHFFLEEKYDHWGNIIKPSGIRLKGGLFYNENVQKALKAGGVLSNFHPYIKYPRTYHLPTSPNLQNDDRMHQDLTFFENKEVVVSIKMDGENTTLYPDYIHARSIDSKHHESRSWVKSLHGTIANEIPFGWRICGENLFAKHSIHYRNLPSYFEVFSIWNEKNIALNWEDTISYSEILNLDVVPTFYRGVWDPDLIHDHFLEYCDKSEDEVEGYVIRIIDEIPYGMFHKSTAKWVRKGHVQTSKFWMSEKVIPNDIIT